MKNTGYKIAAFLLAVIFALSLCACKEQEEADEGFTVPKHYAAAVKVTVDNSVKFFLDDNDAVLAIQFSDSVSKSVFNDLRGKVENKSVEEALTLFLKKAIKQDILTKGKTVTLDVVELMDLTKLDALMYKLDMTVSSIIDRYGLEDITVNHLYKGEEKGNAYKEKYAINVENDKSSAVPDKGDKNTASAYISSVNEKNSEKRFEKSFRCFELTDDGLKVTILNFFETGTCSYLTTKYVSEQKDDVLTLDYNGTTWYEDTSAGSMGVFTKKDKKITVTDTITKSTMQIKLTDDQSIIVIKTAVWLDSFKTDMVLSPI